MTDTSTEALIERIRANYKGQVLTSLTPLDQDILGLCNHVEKINTATKVLAAENKVWGNMIDRFFNAVMRQGEYR